MVLAENHFVLLANCWFEGSLLFRTAQIPYHAQQIAKKCFHIYSEGFTGSAPLSSISWIIDFNHADGIESQEKYLLKKNTHKKLMHLRFLLVYHYARRFVIAEMVDN